MKRVFTVIVLLILVLSLSGCTMLRGLYFWEAIEFTANDEEELRALYDITDEMDVTFIRSIALPELPEYDFDSESFFYINTDDVKPYIANLIAIDWHKCSSCTENFREFKFDDGRYYTYVTHVHRKYYDILVVYKPMGVVGDQDKYLVYVRKDARRYLSKMKRLELESKSYNDIYCLGIYE